MNQKNIFINNNNSVLDAYRLMEKNSIKTLCVVDAKNSFLGTLSDGDIRNRILKKGNLDSSINSIYNKNSFYFKSGNYSKNNIKKIFLRERFDFIPVVNKKKKIDKIIFFDQSFNLKNKYVKNHIIIMAGGKGIRLKPYTEIIPKPLLSIKGRAMIQVVIEDFLENGFNNFIISTGYKDKLMKAFFYENYFGGNINFIEEKDPLGTAGPLYRMKDIIKDTFFVVNADTFLKTEKSKIINFHKKNKCDLTVVVALKKFIIPYGVCEIKKNNNLKKITEKPSKNILANIGTYVCEPKILNYIKNNKNYDFNQLIDRCIKEKLKVMLYIVKENSWVDLGSKTNFFNYKN